MTLIFQYLSFIHFFKINNLLQIKYVNSYFSKNDIKNLNIFLLLFKERDCIVAKCVPETYSTNVKYVAYVKCAKTVY